MSRLYLCLLLSCLATVALAQPGDLEIGSGDPALEVETNYNSSLAERARAERFYCLGYVNSSDPNSPIGQRQPFPTENVTDIRVWTLWLQWPVISFLDIERKGTLFAIIVDLLQDEGGYENLQPSDICVGNVIHNNVAEYSEGVFLHIYFVDPDPPMDPINTEKLVTDFRAAVNRARGDESERVVEFRSRNTIYLLGEVRNNSKTDFQKYPPASYTNPRNDPTFNAIILGSYAGQLTRNQARDRGRASYASNPDPINYGLEAGDIVFAVFGSIFLAILSAMVVLGYFIHPFFLA